MYLLVLFYCALSLLHATLLRSLSSLLFSIIHLIYSLLFSIPYFAFLISVSRQYLILWLPLRMCMLQHMSIYDYIRTYLTYLQRMWDPQQEIEDAVLWSTNHHWYESSKSWRVEPLNPWLALVANDCNISHRSRVETPEHHRLKKYLEKGICDGSPGGYTLED